MHENHSIGNDVHVMLNVVASWGPTLFLTSSFSGVVKLGFFAMSGVLTILTIIDQCMKIHWKIKTRRREKQGHGLTTKEQAFVKEIVRELRSADEKL